MSTPPIGLERKRQPTRWALMSHTSQAGESFFFFFQCWNVSQYYYLYRCVVVFPISALMLCFFFFSFLITWCFFFFFSLSLCTTHRPCFALPFFFFPWFSFWALVCILMLHGCALPANRLTQKKKLFFLRRAFHVRATQLLSVESALLRRVFFPLRECVVRLLLSSERTIPCVPCFITSMIIFFSFW